MKRFSIGDRVIDDSSPTLVIAEIGINHGGSLAIAKEMVKSARRAGAEIIKHQTHVIEDEMTSEARKIVPENADVSIFEIIKQCRLNFDEEIELMEYTKKLGMTYISTPFSRAAANFLMEIGVPAFKIGSGECSNYPLIDHIARFGKPIILSTGMSDIDTIRGAVNIFEKHRTQFVLLHCVNIYPVSPHLLNLGAICSLRESFPNIEIGFSDHSIGNYASFAAVALGANIIEKHYTDHFGRDGPDISCSMDEQALSDLIHGCAIIRQARGGDKRKIPEELATERFAHATIVSINHIQKGDLLTENNIWVKRPGTGNLGAKDFWKIVGKIATRDIEPDEHLVEEDYA